MTNGMRTRNGFSWHQYAVSAMKKQPQKPEHKEYVTIREAAECLGISEKRVYRLVENGVFSGKKIGKIRLIRYADIVNYEKED